MLINRLRGSNFLLLVLLAGFLSAQLLTAAHGATHELSVEADQCSICLRGGQHKAALLDAVPTDPSLACVSHPNHHRPPTLLQAPASIRHARGPPAPVAV